ncbi:Eukaryotic translation initiation factor 2D [Homalodisca vitripennis]|nr:Eukaryotic translation initiation factor 2D [Homalodisca vitripennis]
MYPTVYTLWHVPELLPTFTTHPQVLPVIARGADLMLPGVILPHGPSLHAYGRLQRGERVAVNLSTNKAPVAVGLTAHSSYDMYMAAGRGKCVEVLHYYGDLLSTYGTKLSVPELGPAFHTDDSNSVEQVTDQLDSVDTLVSDADKVDLPSGEAEENFSELAQGISNSELEEESNMFEVDSSSSPDVCPDELLKHCFYKALKTTMKKIDLPLLTSNFYKLHMIPACPKERTLDIKKSSYKKLSNFLDEMVKTGVINTESLQKGVQSISKIDYSHESLKHFVDNFSNEEDGTCLSVDTTQTNKSSAPEITEKYTVTAAVLPLFYEYDYK